MNTRHEVIIQEVLATLPPLRNQNRVKRLKRRLAKSLKVSKLK